MDPPELVEGQNVQDGSYIKINDAQFPLFIPSGMESGLKLVREFTVGQGGATSRRDGRNPMSRDFRL